MTTPEKAVAEYLRREKAAMKTTKGADHQAILEDVAGEFGVETDVLTEMVLDATIAGAC